MHCTLFYKHNCTSYYADLQINIITFILKNSPNIRYSTRYLTRGRVYSTLIHQFCYSALTRLRSPIFSICLDDETWVGTPLCRYLLSIYVTIGSSQEKRNAHWELKIVCISMLNCSSNWWQICSMSIFDINLKLRSTEY